MKKKKTVCRRLIDLAKHGFGLSKDTFLKSVKKFLGKKVRTIPFNMQPLAFPTIPQSFAMFYFTMLGSHIELYKFLKLIARLLCKCKRS